MANGQLNFGKQSGGVLTLAFPDGVNNTEVVLPESGNLVSVGTAVTDNAIARFDGTTGKLQNSSVVIDDNGNVGVGVTTSAWNGAAKALQVGTVGIQNDIGLNVGSLSTNSYYDSTNHRYIHSLTATRYTQYNGSHTWQTAPSGTAGNAITWTNAMSLDANGNLLLTSGTGALGYGAGAGGIVTQLTSKTTSVTLNKPTGQIIMNNGALAAGASVAFTVNNSTIVGAENFIATLTNLNGVDVHQYNVWTGVLAVGVGVIMLKNIGAVSLSQSVGINFAIIKGAIS